MAENDPATPMPPSEPATADREVAPEQDAVTGDIAVQVIPPEQAPMDDAAGGPQAESEAHPS